MNRQNREGGALEISVIKNTFLKKYAMEQERSKEKVTYQIIPGYGNGKTVIYPIIQGMYLILNEFTLKDQFKNNIDECCFSNSFIKIEYCLKGKYMANFKDGKVAVVKGNSVYYVRQGNNHCLDADFKGKKYQSISIFCYLNEIINSMEQLLGVSKDTIKGYYERLAQSKKGLIVETELEVMGMINKIHQYIKSAHVELIKPRVIELFLLEMNRFDDYCKKRKKCISKLTVDKIELIKKYIEENMQEHITIDQLAKRFDIGITNLKESFKYLYGTGIYTYLRNYRMEKAGELLRNSDYNILEIANILGYSNQSNFGAVFKNCYGVSPLKYRKSI